MSFDLPSTELGELCRDWCMSLLLADPVQDTGAVKPNARGAMYVLRIGQRFSNYDE